MSPEITTFRVDVPETVLDDLRARLQLTRWPEPETGDDWSQGGYDWRAAEARLNQFPQFRTTIDDVDIHFLHVRSPHAGARPLIMTHGWPGSVVEFLKV